MIDKLFKPSQEYSVKDHKPLFSSLLLPPPPPPMEEIKGALLEIKELQAAVERAANSWRLAQLEDALNSIEFFTQRVREALKTTGGEADA